MDIPENRMNRIAEIRKKIDTYWESLSAQGRTDVRIMEICGTHTVSISRTGLRATFPKGLKLISGPGCPVCVTGQSYVDKAIYLARQPDVIIATYGDMIRVPGATGSLEAVRGEGGKVEVVYSAHQAVDLARRCEDKQVVFLAIGFETTAPATALAIRQADEQKISNFFILSSHKLVIPAMRALLNDKDIRIDGFLCPGHVSVITGWRVYESIVNEFARPCVVAGFDDEQILKGICEILRQLVEQSPAACCVYPAVSETGNQHAQQVIHETFDVIDTYWRGIGIIPASGLGLKERFSRFDADKRFNLPVFEEHDPPGCRCGEVISGKCIPPECPLFGTICTPREPVGPCMVSSEGSCAAYYKYDRH